MTTSPAPERTNLDYRLLSVEEVAHMIGVPRSTLYAWRMRDAGPKSRRIGKLLKYRPEDVAKWIDAQD